MLQIQQIPAAAPGISGCQQDAPATHSAPQNAAPSAGVQARSPKVSVLIPTYNYARYLPEAIESVLEQEFQDFEMVIVDDCSSDDSRSVIRHYAAVDGRIRFRFNPVNLGMVGNWNYCLSQARGEYVQFLFGDDKLASRKTLGKMAGLLDQNPSAVLAAAARNIIDDNSNILEIAAHLGASGVYRGRDVITRCLEKNANLIGEPSVVMLRRTDAGRGFDARYRQIPDLEMWFHLLEKGNAVYTSEPLCSFRRHPRQQTEVNRINQVGERENMELLAGYFVSPWLNVRQRPQLLFSQIYWLRKKMRGDPASRELESRMMAVLGPGRYRRCWIQYKLCRPFSNFRRFCYKYLLGRSVK